MYLFQELVLFIYILPTASYQCQCCSTHGQLVFYIYWIFIRDVTTGGPPTPITLQLKGGPVFSGKIYFTNSAYSLSTIII